MANADLDTIIRQLAKQQHKSLTTAAKARKAHYLGLAAKAKTADAKQRLRALADHALEEGLATIRRLQMSADNAADSYARAMRKALDAVNAAPAVIADKAAKAASPKAKAVSTPAADSKPAKSSKGAKAKPANGTTSSAKGSGKKPPAKKAPAAKSAKRGKSKA